MPESGAATEPPPGGTAPEPEQAEARPAEAQEQPEAAEDGDSDEEDGEEGGPKRRRRKYALWVAYVGAGYHVSEPRPRRGALGACRRARRPLLPPLHPPLRPLRAAAGRA